MTRADAPPAGPTCGLASPPTKAVRVRSLIRLLGVGRELWPFYLGITLASVATAALTLLVPFITKLATDDIVAMGAGRGPDVSALIWLAAALLGVELANTVLSNVGGYLGDLMSVRLKAILSSRYYTKLLSLPQRYFDSELTGTIINRLTRSIGETSQFMQMFANTFLPMLLTVIATLVITASYSGALALLLIVIYPLFMWLTTLTSRRWQLLEQLKNEHFDIAGGRFAEAVGQMRVVKSYTSELRELSLFNRHYRAAADLTRGQSSYWHLMDVLRRGALNLIFFAIYAIIFVQTANGAFSLGSMVLLLQLVAMAKQPVQMMSYLVDSSQRAIAGSVSYFEAIDELPEPRTAIGDADALTFATPHVDAAVLPREPWPARPDADAIVYDHVSFAYEEGADVLDDITFAVRQGERIAFVGESGGGKTTLVNLLLGLYRPHVGQISLLGTPVNDIPLGRLRAEIGVVFQDSSLFSGTIRENIAYGRPDASDFEVREAARRANALSFIEKLPEGLDCEIGERGIKLSGGQKQRIAVARALLKDAPILVLDEATSALDTKAERQVQAGLEELMAGRTTLIIAHRLSTISSVDRIVTLRDGRIDEIGTPDELARSGGIYAELLALQASATKTDRRRLQAFDITG